MPRGKVQRVIDGDTVVLEDDTRVRLAGVDAPERKREGGPAAKRELEDLIKDKTITYTEDSMSYGRVVGKIKVGPKDVNKEMVKRLKEIKKKSKK